MRRLQLLNRSIMGQELQSLAFTTRTFFEQLLTASSGYKFHLGKRGSFERSYHRILMKRRILRRILATTRGWIFLIIGHYIRKIGPAIDCDRLTARQLLGMSNWRVTEKNRDVWSFLSRQT